MKKIISIIVSGLLLVSCLDTVILPDDKTVEEDFWQTKSDVALMVNGAYAKMSTSSLQQRLVVWTSRSDELNLNFSLNNRDLNQIYSANIQTTNSYANWSDLYAVINACNLVISKSAEVMDIDPNYMEGDHLNNVAQMKALRSLCYFYLVRVFRDVPLILEPYKNSSQEMNVPQTAPSIVIDQIIADLEEVKNNTLSSQAINDWTRCGYFTRDGLYALLADVYLWKASIYDDEYCYDKVIEYSNIIRNNRKNMLGAMGPNGQALDDDGWKLNTAANYYNMFDESGNAQESLFELQFTNNDGLCIVFNRTNNNTNAQPQFYASRPYAKIGTGRANYVYDNANYYTYDIRGFESVYDFNGAADDGFYIRKHVGMNGLTMMGTNPASEIRPMRAFNPYDQNWIVYRATDVMLMKAEAMVQLVNDNDTTEGADVVRDSLLRGAFAIVEVVNTRSNFGSTESALAYDQYSSKSLMTALVLEERQRELMFEGKRWFDLVRRAEREGDTNYLIGRVTRKGSDNASVVQSKLSRMDGLYWPYNKAELQVNPNLKQNPAYPNEDDGSYQSSIK